MVLSGCGLSGPQRADASAARALGGACAAPGGTADPRLLAFDAVTFFVLPRFAIGP